jgi:hypothetical protein
MVTLPCFDRAELSAMRGPPRKRDVAGLQCAEGLDPISIRFCAKHAEDSVRSLSPLGRGLG